MNPDRNRTRGKREVEENPQRNEEKERQRNWGGDGEDEALWECIWGKLEAWLVPGPGGILKIRLCRGSWCEQRYAGCRAEQRHRICSGTGGVVAGHLVELRKEHKRREERTAGSSEAERPSPCSPLSSFLPASSAQNSWL